MGRVKNTAAHHVMPPGFEHQPRADPVILTDKMLALLAHVGSFQDRSALFDQSYRVSAGMSINTCKRVFHTFLPGWVSRSGRGGAGIAM